MRSSLRQLVKHPAHMAAVIVSLGIGLAVCIAVFSSLNAFAFEPVPGVDDRSRLVNIRWSTDNFLTRSELDAIDADGIDALASIAVEGDRDVSMSLPAGPATVSAAFVSIRFFETLGTTPIAGRLLTAADADSPVAVISERLWKTAFDGARDVIGEAVDIAGTRFTIVGITPSGFPGLRPRDIGQSESDYPQLWVPLESGGQSATPSPELSWLSVQGRLRNGRTVTEAQAVLGVSGARLAASSPRRHDAVLRVFRAGLDWETALWDSSLAVGLFLFVPIGVLGIGCANVVTLQLARATERERELSVRLALGASRARLIRLLAEEVVVLAVASGAVGVLGGYVMLVEVQAWFPSPVGIDHRVLVFALTLTTSMVAAAGLLPAWFATRRVVAAGLRDAHDDGPRHIGARAALVILQVAASLALLFISGLAIRTLQTQSPVIPRDAQRTLIADVAWADAHPSDTSARRLVDAVLERLHRDEGLAVAFADFSYSSAYFGRPLRYWQRDDESELGRIAAGGFVTPEWFDVMGMPLLTGHGFTASDPGGSDALINEALASRLVGRGTSPIGRRLRIAAPQGRSNRWVDIVGVVANQAPAPDGTTVPMVFLRMPAKAPASLTIFARAKDVTAASTAIRRAVFDADRGVVLLRLQSLDARLRGMLKVFREMTWFGAGLGVLALLQTAAGLYAVMAYTVRRRTREIGVRMAIGSPRRAVVLLVVRQGFAPVLLGASAGLAIAVPVSFLLRSVFLGVSPLDAWAVLPAIGLIGGVASIAAALPAYRAVSVDPVVALRDE